MSKLWNAIKQVERERALAQSVQSGKADSERTGELPSTVDQRDGHRADEVPDD